MCRPSEKKPVPSFRWQPGCDCKPVRGTFEFHEQIVVTAVCKHCGTPWIQVSQAGGPQP